MAIGDLTTLAEANSYLHIPTSDTSSDTFISSAITNLTAAIQRECGRTFIATDYLEVHNTSVAQARIIPINPPIIKVNSLRWGYATAIQLGYSGPAVNATAYVTAARTLVLRTIDSTGVTDSTIDLTATNKTLWSQVVTAINLVSGWTAALQGGIDGPSRWLTLGCNFVCKTTNATYLQYLTWYPIDVFNYTIDTVNNVIGFSPLSYVGWLFDGGQQGGQFGASRGAWPAQFQGVMLDYRGGYEVIPLDLNLLCQQMVADLYNQSNLDMNLQSDKLGDAQVTLIDPMLRRAVYNDVLAPYKTVPIAGGLF